MRIAKPRSGTAGDGKKRLGHVVDADDGESASHTAKQAKKERSLPRRASDDMERSTVQLLQSVSLGSPTPETKRAKAKAKKLSAVSPSKHSSIEEAADLAGLAGGSKKVTAAQRLQGARFRMLNEQAGWRRL